MKLKDLIEYDFITDKTSFSIQSIQIIQTSRHQKIKNEKWYNDSVLDFLDFNVRKFTYYSDLDLLKVSLVFPDNKENKQEIKPPKQGPTKEFSWR